MSLTQRQHPKRQYADWKAPAQDSQILVWPEPAELLRQTLTNRDSLVRASNVAIQNLPLPEIRSAMRRHLGHADDQPFIATGHQTELYHAGVWAKHAAINAVAGKIDGSAYHLAVDTDAPKHLHLRWPGESLAITDDPKLSSAAWSGQLAPPSLSYLNEIESHFGNATKDWAFKPAAGGVLESLKRSSSSPESLSEAITSSTQKLDESLGLTHQAVLASPIWMSQPFLSFAHDLLANAAKFSRIYNDALKDYRDLNNMKTTMRPMPDLFVSAEAFEAPFWLDNLADGSRSRPSVFARDTSDGGGFVLEMLSGEEFHFDPKADGWIAAQSLHAFLVKNNHRLSPRALTLTLFARVCLADNFIHGIGGGRYDQVTDQIIEKYFGLESPAFAVSTATLFLPQALTRARVCLPCFVHEGHQLQHRVLGDAKMALVNQINSLPRKSRERGQIFMQMHQQLRQSQDHPLLRNWKNRLTEAQTMESENAVFFDRELFYAMQPKSRLSGLIERYRDAFA